MKYIVGSAVDIAPGQQRLVEVAGRSIGIFNVNGRFYALRNVCIHNQAPVCLGEVGGTYLPSAPDEYCQGLMGQVLRCPWHGWEFDITTGQSLFDPSLKLKRYPVTVENGKLVVEVRGKVKG